MFTGIVSEVGTVIRAGRRIAVEAPGSASRLETGGSIAVNGACLTAVAIDHSGFEADVVDETLARTNLGALAEGSSVNLELPLKAGAPLDGHLVQGHVDGVGEVQQLHEAASGRELKISLPEALAHYVAEKGSIAVDGVSLTVTAVGDGFFGVALIPHTLANTLAGEYAAGSMVNLEVDLLARYLERLVRTRTKTP